jgi:hypothetical protein
VAEEFRFDQVARDGGHVDGHERPVAPLAVVMQRAGDQFLAGTRFARDHQRQIGLHEACQDAIDLLHRRGTADERHAVLHVVVETGRLLLRFRKSPPDDGDELGQVEGLGKIVVGALFGGLDGGHESVLGAHDQDRQVGPRLLDARQEVEGVLIRHDDIGHHQIALARRDPPPEGGGVGGDPDVVAGPRQRLVQHRADGRVVVGDKDRGSHWSFPVVA